MAYAPATQKPLLRARFDTALGAAVDDEGGDRRQAIVDAIVEWFGTDVLPTLTVATTTAATGSTIIASGSSAGTWPTTTTGTGTGGVS